MMKTKRELELEIELYSTREQLLRAGYEIMMRDKETNDELLSNAQFELDKVIQQENKLSDAGIKKLTPEQALIISGYTGVLACSASAVKADVEKRLGEPVGDITLVSFGEEKISALYKDDYANLCPHTHPESEMKLTDEQAVIVTGYTGKLLGDVGKFCTDLEKRLGRKIVSSELPSIGQDKVSTLYKADFSSLTL
ncbi:hypothetical protein AAH248_001209 [Klebsiella michiganensis]